METEQQPVSYEQQMIWLANKQARALDAIKVAVWVLAGLAILGVLYGITTALA
jgi:hypothetical protein